MVSATSSSGQEDGKMISGFQELDSWSKTASQVGSLLISYSDHHMAPYTG